MTIEAPRNAADALHPQRTKRARPAVLKGTTRKLRSAMGDVFVTINVDEHGEPFEVFAVVGKAGSALMADVEAICRLASLALRFGVPVEEIYQQLRGISSDRTTGFGAAKVLSVADAIAQAVGHYCATGTPDPATIQQTAIRQPHGHFDHNPPCDQASPVPNSDHFDHKSASEDRHRFDGARGRGDAAPALAGVP